MICRECAYFWEDEIGELPYCHWELRAPGDLPPCEEDDYWSEDEQ